MNGVHVVDLILICVYLLTIVWVGLWFSRSKQSTSKGYFLAGQSLTWPVIGASLFASNISTVHLVGLAESGFVDGILWGNFEWFSILALLLLAFVFVPFFLRTRITTLPEFLEKRYDSRSRIVVAVFSILAAVLMHIGVSFYAGAVVLQEIFGWNVWFSIILIAVATGIYTIIGGLTSVVVTESVQTIILIAGSLTLTILAIIALPEAEIHSMGQFREAVTPDRLVAVSFDAGTKGFSFFDMLFSYLILGTWYWCTDQTIVQRVLGAKDENQAKLGAIFAGFLKILPVFIMVVPGILAFALYHDEIGGNTKSVLPVMIMNLMPMGLKGLMVAALLAAVMSSVAAALNSCSTLLVFDIFNATKNNFDERKKIRLGRITAAVILVAAVIWSPFLGSLGAIFALINQMFSIFAPSIVVVFLFGILSRRGTSTASFIALLGGSVMAMGIFIIEKYIPVNGIENFISSPSGLGINWFRQTCLFFLISSALYWLVSWAGKSPATASTDFYLKISGSSAMVKFLSLVLVTLMVGIYIIFF